MHSLGDKQWGQAPKTEPVPVVVFPLEFSLQAVRVLKRFRPTVTRRASRNMGFSP